VITRSLCIALMLSGLASAWAGEDVSAAGRAYFESKIRPILVEHCYECHSADSDKLGGKLLLDHRNGWSEGGESGPAIAPGDPDSSLLIHALRWEGDLEMPPEEPLSEAVLHDFAQWVKMGAPDPRNDAVKVAAPADLEEVTLWSLQPITDPALPQVKQPDWGRDPLDQFVMAQLEALDLQPTEDAPPRMLARRLYFDLLGLPPTLTQLESFIADYEDRGKAAVESLVDELLASPHFGERWGRHWLDVARYAESNGNDGLSRNPAFPHAWRYRDFVIAALNADMPYDQFITEQLAGDLMKAASPEEKDRQLVATGFLALAAKPAKAMNNNFAMDVVADQIDVVGSGIMGLSVACARCHDHKFDPIPTRDYYAMAGLFTSTDTMWGLAANEKLTAPSTGLHVLKTPPKVLPPEDFEETVLRIQSNTGEPIPVPEPKWPIGTPLAMGAKDLEKDKIKDCQINLKGDAKKLGEAVPRGFLSACGPQDLQVNPEQSGRLELAQWLLSEEHPLTSRVMVNRIWQHLFGQGLVATPDDFGTYGERPTHPDLLDHLATRFMQDEDWSIKQMIRAMVLSRTYQLSSQADETLLAADPANEWLARHNRRRLDAEGMRDSILLVSGQLDPTPGDGSIIRHRDILINLAGNLHEPSNHRSIYLCYLRNSPPPELAAFDLPDFRAVTGQRIVSTRPGQALYLFNNPFVIEQAGHLANEVMTSASDPAERVRQAYRRSLQRSPSESELSAALSLIEATTAELGSEQRAYSSLSQALLSANEFRYID